MAELVKCRAQLYGEDGELIGDVDVVTSADCVFFADGETFEQKLAAGKLTGSKGEPGEAGPQGEKGETGPAGPQGDTGPKGEDGKMLVGTSYESAMAATLFFKRV